MRWRIRMRAENLDSVRRALKRSRVKHVIDAAHLDGATTRGAQDPAVAARMFAQIRSGDTYAAIAKRFGVNYHTVLRLAANPRKYGVDADPISRR